MNERVLAYQFFNLYLYIKHRVLLITFLPNDLDFYQGPVHYSTVATTNTVNTVQYQAPSQVFLSVL